MSVFRGSVVEYPGVIVDHYVPANCERGRIFFLSHCHKDHMTGLGSRALLDALRRRCTFLHCSEVTRALLLHYTEFRDLVPFLKALPMEEPVSVKLEPTLDAAEMNFTVTLLPAGHCPGSAMFLFEGSSGTALYTGDFRLTVDETKRIQCLHPGGKLLDITTLYLDTTFCSPIASDIPDRETSRQFILSCTADWLARSPQNAVLLQCTMFGFEHVFMGVSQKLSTKVHVGSWRHNVYSEIPAVHECLTCDGQSTRVHSCSFRKGQQRTSGLPCGSKGPNGRPFHVLTIKPSTQWFLSSNRSTGSCPCVFLPKQNMYRIMHSMHSSFSEICSFVAYIRPRQIVPCVVPSGDSALTDVHARLKVFLSGSFRQHSPSVADDQVTLVDVICRGEEEEGECSSESDPEWQGQREEDYDDNANVTIWESKQKKCDASPIGLPSMLIDDGEDHSPSSPVDGLDSAGTEVTGGTVGSLEQTPVDLYLSCDSASSQIADHENPVTACGGGKIEKEVVNITTGCNHPDGSTSVPAARTNGVSNTLDIPAARTRASLGNEQVFADGANSNLGKPVVLTDAMSEAVDVKDVDGATCTGPQPLVQNPSQATNGMKEQSLFFCGEDEGLVLLGQSYHRQRRRSSVEVKCDASEDLEPRGKRLRWSCPGSSEGPTCACIPPCAAAFNSVSKRVQSSGASQPPLGSQLHPSLLPSIGTTEGIVFIDLTKDDDTGDPTKDDDTGDLTKDDDTGDPTKDDDIGDPTKDDDTGDLTKDDDTGDLTKDDDDTGDLTKDDDDTGESDESVVLCKGVQDKDDPDDIIVLSGSSSTSAQLASVHGKEEDNLSDSGLPSPESSGYLPPSPGREGVSSILKRKALGF